MIEDIDGSNKFFIGVQGDQIISLRSGLRPMSKADALNLAAWLVTLAGTKDEFARYLEKVQS